MSRADEITAAALAALTGATDAEARVYDARTTPLEDDATYPALVVYPPDDSGESASIGITPYFAVTWKLVVEGVVDAGTDAAMRAAAAKLGHDALTALFCDSDFTGNFEREVRYSRTLVLDSEARRRRAKVLLTIEATTHEYFAEEPSDDLDTLHIDVVPLDPVNPVNPSDPDDKPPMAEVDVEGSP